MFAYAGAYRILADDPLLPLHLLVFAVQTAVTTLTCVADMVSWTMISWEEKSALGWLYGPYLALCESFVSAMFDEIDWGWRPLLMPAGGESGSDGIGLFWEGEGEVGGDLKKGVRGMGWDVVREGTCGGGMGWDGMGWEEWFSG